MNIAETISVNPVSKTLGVLNPEATQEFIRSHSSKIKSRNLNKRCSGNVLLATTTPTIKDFGIAMLLLRFLFATLLIVSGSFILYGEILSDISFIDPQIFAISEIVVGSMLALGLFSRVAMAAATLCFGYASILAIEAGVFDMQSLLLCLGSSFFLIMGTGRFSCDFLIRKALLIRRHRKELRLREDRLSYRAYRVQNL